jgi:outer membrane protein OmpA-like peptidoglycan-associated protein
MLFDLSAKRAATLGLLSVFLGACPVLVATGDLAAQSTMPSDHVGSVVPEVAGSAQASDPAAPTQAGNGAAAGPSPFTELKKALAAAQAKLEELSRVAEAVAPVGQLRQELQEALELNQLLTSDLATLAESRRELKSSNEAAQARIAKMTAAALDAAAEIKRLRGEIDVLRSNAERSADLQRAIRKVLEANRRREEIAKAKDALASATREEAKVTIDQLKSRLAAAEQQVSELKATNASLSADLRAFQTAASNATDMARQNLEAITSGVDTLNAVQNALGSDLVSALESKEKLQVEALLTDLKPVVERSGLLMTVPGSPLFRADSSEIEQMSYSTLAKVAELINIYRTHRVLIVGHTDASGDAAYNQMLSKRRADLVKQFLVGNFDVDAARLITEGKGEDAPIASNGTLVGREANRRIEVLLLN